MGYNVYIYSNLAENRAIRSISIDPLAKHVLNIPSLLLLLYSNG